MKQIKGFSSDNPETLGEEISKFINNSDKVVYEDIKYSSTAVFKEFADEKEYSALLIYTLKNH